MSNFCNIPTNAGMSPEFLRDQLQKLRQSQKPIDYVIIGPSGAAVLMEAICSGKLRAYSTPQGEFKIEGVTIRFNNQQPDVNLAVAIPPLLDFRFYPDILQGGKSE